MPRGHEDEARLKSLVRLFFRCATIGQNSTMGMALGYYMGSMPQAAWWRKMSGSGGQFNEQTTHIVDLLRYLCGEVAEVYAAFGNRRVDGAW